MIEISFVATSLIVTALYIAARLWVWISKKAISWKREAVLLLVYVCLMVVLRCTFHPFAKADGQVQPLIFDASLALKFQINWVPFVNLMDYPKRSSALLNIIGNTTMFIPIGVVWPSVYKQLNTHWKVLVAGAGISLTVELLQLPFYDRVSDIDDLLLNTLGFAVGYGIYLLVKWIAAKCRKERTVRK